MPAINFKGTCPGCEPSARLRLSLAEWLWKLLSNLPRCHVERRIIRETGCAVRAARAPMGA